MALIKIHAEAERLPELRAHVAMSIKLIGAAALNSPVMSATLSSTRTAYVEAFDLTGIDYMVEIIGLKRPDEQKIADAIVAGLKEVYPDAWFYVYFMHNDEDGMSSSRDSELRDDGISMDEAIELAKSRSRAPRPLVL